MTARLTVLVVDDEPDVCWALETLLRAERFKVVTAGSGSDALQWLKESGTACHLILVDAKLPDIDGVDLTRRIRSETSCDAPMILVSGYFYDHDSLVQDTLRVGLVCAFVTKPFHHAEMLSTIDAVLSSHSSNTVSHSPHREPSP